MSDPAFTAPRPDLVLPNELLHKVILWVLCDGVHSICTSTEDTAWEQNMMTTLHQVSPAFKAISSELAAKAFDISRDVRSNDDAYATFLPALIRKTTLTHIIRQSVMHLSSNIHLFESSWG
jgi:hypothetical protein